MIHVSSVYSMRDNERQLSGSIHRATIGIVALAAVSDTARDSQCRDRSHCSYECRQIYMHRCSVRYIIRAERKSNFAGLSALDKAPGWVRGEPTRIDHWNAERSRGLEKRFEAWMLCDTNAIFVRMFLVRFPFYLEGVTISQNYF